jgi:hypothetical protein
LIQYRNGNVANWPLLVESTLAIKDLVYPAGWRPDSKTQYNNHNNYDLLTIFFYGWPHMNADQKRRARIEIAAMLEWCLTQSLREDGFDPAGGSAIDAYYFGVRFLDRAGFWDPDKRFWLHRMPELPKGTGSAEEICRRLQEGFARLRDQSEEGETVAKLLKVAACLSGPQP